MRIDPAIAALRADRGLQRRAQQATIAACDSWRAQPETAAALVELEAFGKGAPLDACSMLSPLFTDRSSAHALARALCGAMGRALAGDPFGHPPLRHGFDGQVSTLLLARAGRAQLVLHSREPGKYAFKSASFSDALRYEAVLAGTASGRLVRHAGQGFDLEVIELGDGARLALDLSSEALQVVEVERRIVSLRLNRFAAEPEPTREFDLSDGTLIHQSSGDLASSRREMMLAVLGRMKVAAAATTMAAMAVEPGDTSLRWQALRESLALNTALGFRALLAVARAADDPLCAAAGALRAQLVEAHPQLLALEEG